MSYAIESKKKKNETKYLSKGKMPDFISTERIVNSICVGFVNSLEFINSSCQSWRNK